MTIPPLPTLLRNSLLAGLVLGIRSLAAEPDFQKDVLPLLQQKCIDCHGAEKQKGKLRLDSKEATFKGGKDGPALKAKDSAGSELIKRVSLPAGNDDRMPPEGDGLTAEQIAVLKAWIDAGAAWPEGVVIESKNKPKTTAAPVRQGPPLPPLPELPKEFKAAAGEAAALATLSKAGLEVRPIAQNSAWREANFRLAGTNVTDASIAPLKEVTSLIELNLGATRITDAGLANLSHLGYLQNLQAPLTGITDAGLARLKGLSNLVSINLYGTQISDAGLEHLRGLKHLRSVYVWQTKVTPEGAAKLKESLPWLYVNTGAELAALATNTPPAEKKEEKK
ncbi:MAG: hypothetical protein RLZ45_816 [Verrucomicrobiota bacterium]|jgi:hypothetical protein